MAKKTQTAPPSLYVGTSGWAYSIWKPEFYPKDVSAKNFLKFYATKLNAVEVNYTFRRLLSEKAAESWMKDAGPNFQFVAKANQYITHMRRLKDAEEPLRAISADTGAVAKAQTAWSGAVPASAELQGGRDCCCASFWRSCRAVVKYAFEFRHESWFNDETYQALKKHNVALVYRGDGVDHHSRGANRQVHLLSLSQAKLRRLPNCRKLADRVERCLADGLETYAFFKHEEDPRSPLNAVELLKAVRKKSGGLNLACYSRTSRCKPYSPCAECRSQSAAAEFVSRLSESREGTGAAQRFGVSRPISNSIPSFC